MRRARCGRMAGHAGYHRSEASVAAERHRQRMENLTPEQRDQRRARDARYVATTNRWVTWRRYSLKTTRERILDELAALHREEEAWRTRSDTTTQTR